MPKYYNNNPLYGDRGPHEAESVEELADEMAELFYSWAVEEWLGTPDCGLTQQMFIHRAMQRMRSEFIEGLEVIK